MTNRRLHRPVRRVEYPRPSWVQLLEFYWQKTNGTQVLATNLVPALANNNERASLGNGTYTPCACHGW